ncbi:hypothetical protein VTK73DRAFT_3408 [Phialemonium thermophilum]|uniref:Replication factor C subunit 1 n=1 Tax=Phialemonium thermophilum TaxID=223376 RepID=A0ABR3WZU8_9PEZI
MPDIRSFFGRKDGAPPPKPTPKKEEELTKKGRPKGRKVIDDSDDDTIPNTQKPTSKTTSKKPVASEPVKGVEISASDYFASGKTKATGSQAPPKATSTQPRPGVEVRISPRTKRSAPKPSEEPQRSPLAINKKRPTTAYSKQTADDDDAFLDDDLDADDDIFAASAKGGSKRKGDDYVEDDSEPDLLPQAKRVASRARPSVKDESEDERKSTTRRDAPQARASTPGKKRKSLEDTDDEESDVVVPRKRAAPAKPRTPRAKKASEPESSDVQHILDNVPTVEAPDAPPPDPNAKFDWRKAAASGTHTGPPPNAGAAEIPEGAEDCLLGKTFVFTGQLKTISRDEAQALVKRYGGKVTGAPSSKTDFVVLGDDAGPSKLRKIKEHGIKTIDEEGLFYLIRTMPAHGGSGKGAEKAKQKLEEEQRKIQQQVEEMEKEEKARRAEAAKQTKTAASSGGSAAPAANPASSQLWTTKYAPTQLSHICGNKANVEKIQAWLRNWPKARKYNFQKRGADGMGAARAILISGPPGIGKTTAAHLAAKLEGYDVLETNASDARSKKLVEAGVGEILDNTSLLGYFSGDGKKVEAAKKKIVLVMDEVDGMSAGDRGGVGALAKLCKKTEVPMILICNERRLPKMKPFDFVTYDIKFQRPTVDQIRSRIMTICHREGLKMPPQVVNALIEGSNRDIRQIINMIATAKLDQTAMDYDQSKAMSKAWEKHIILKPWDICAKMLGGGLFSPASKATLNDKIELYFNDHEFSFLMIQENYLRTKPALLSGKGYNAREANLKYLELVDQAAESISDGDLVDRMIHGPQQHWSLMPVHAVFSTVRPSSFVAGALLGTNFTSWLGNNSKAGKLGRYVREIQSHMRLKSSGDHNEVRQQYLPVLWYQLVKRLEVEGKDAVEDVINLMDSYYLTREDFDSIKELGVGYQSEENVNIESQTKATFTRLYNSMSHPVPFMRVSSVIGSKKATKEMPDLEEAIEEDDEMEGADAAEVVEEEDELDIKGDKYIKQPKAKGGRKATKKAAAAAAADDDDGEGGEPAKSAKGKGKGKAAGGRGKAAKK